MHEYSRQKRWPKQNLFGPNCTKRSWPEKNILGHMQNLFTSRKISLCGTHVTESEAQTTAMQKNSITTCFSKSLKNRCVNMKVECS